jgi:hypothetical protein
MSRSQVRPHTYTMSTEQWLAAAPTALEDEEKFPSDDPEESEHIDHASERALVRSWRL